MYIYIHVYVYIYIYFSDHFLRLLFQVLLKRHRYNDVGTILTNKTTMEVSLSANDNYLIQIKAVSEGGEGAGSEPIHIHKLSECPSPHPLPVTTDKALVMIQ